MDYKLQHSTSYFGNVTFQNAIFNLIPDEFFNKNETDEPFDIDVIIVGGQYIRDGGILVMQKLLDHSDNQLRMYGSARELLNEFQVYRNFPMSYKYFAVYPYEPYGTNVTYYKNLQNEFFISKHDLLVCLEAHVLWIWKNDRVETNSFLVSIFIKTCEAQLDGCFEFVRYDPKIFEDLDEELDKIVTKITNSVMRKSPIINRYLPNTNNSQEVYNQWKQLLWPTCTDEEKMKAFAVIVDDHLEKYPYQIQCQMHAQVLYTCHNFFETLRKFMKDRPEMFWPYSEKNSENAPIAVRIFEDGSQQFVMKSELFKAINIRNPKDPKIDNPDKNGFYSTMSLSDVSKKYESRVDRIEFLRTPIKHIQYGSVPIMTFDGDYCILAKDAFAEIMYRLIFVEKIFQKIRKATLHLLDNYMIMVDAFVGEEPKFFINLNCFNEFKKESTEYWKDFKNHPTKYIRNAKKDGFTVENLKNELKNLTLTDLFPEIVGYARVVYRKIDWKKSGKYLRTCDLFTAIAQCLEYCIAKNWDFTRPFLDLPISEIFPTGLIQDKKSIMGDDENKENENPFKNPSEKIESKKSGNFGNFKKSGNSENPEEPGSSRKSENHGRLEESEKSEIFEQMEIFEKLEKTKTFQSLIKSGIFENVDLSEIREKMLKSEAVKKLAEAGFFENYENSRNPENSGNFEKSSNSGNFEKSSNSGNFEKSSNSGNFEKSQHANKSGTSNESGQSINSGNSQKSGNPQNSGKSGNFKKSENQEDTCPDCIQLTQLNSEIKKELKATQHTLRTAEKKAKKSDDLEKKVSNLEKKLENIRKNEEVVKEKMKKNLAEMEKKNERLMEQATQSTKQIDGLKREVLGKTSELSKINKTLVDTRNQLNSKNAKLEEDLKKEKMNLHVAKQGILNLEHQLEEKMKSDQRLIAENTEIIKKLQNSISQLTKRNEDLEKINISANLSIDRPAGYRDQLLGLWKIKDIFMSGKPMKNAVEMTEKLISLTTRPEIHQMATYEFQQYEGKVRNYMQSVETNLQKMKATAEGSELLQLPEFPSFSDRFMIEYWSQIKNLSAPPPEIDTECVICYEEMRSDDVEKLMKCDECNKSLHLECASKWLVDHQTCPFCRSKLLDPNEFPTLS